MTFLTGKSEFEQIKRRVGRQNTKAWFHLCIQGNSKDESELFKNTKAIDAGDRYTKITENAFSLFTKQQKGSIDEQVKTIHNQSQANQKMLEEISSKQPI